MRALLALILAVFGYAVLRLSAPFDVPSPPTVISSVIAQTDKRAGPPKRDADPKQYTALAEHPLFVEGRSPPALETAKTVDEEMNKGPQVAGLDQLKNLILDGIVALGDIRIALVRSNNSSETRRIKVGDDLNGWKVIAVERDALTVSNGAEEQQLKFPVPPVNGVQTVSQINAETDKH